MPGQKQKGKKNVRVERNKHFFVEPDFSLGHLIAVIKNTHGGYPPRFTCQSINGEEFVAPIQGSIAKGPKRQLVRKEDTVLCIPMECDTMTMNTNSLESKKFIIHHVYDKDDIRILEKKGYLSKKTISKEEDMVIIGDGVKEEKAEISELDISLI